MPDDSRAADTKVRVTQNVHGRLKAHCRDGETLSGAIGRALDALDRERALPGAVTEAMEEDENA